MHIKGQNRGQATLFPRRLDKLITEWLASTVTPVEKEVMVTVEDAGRSHTALAAPETEREDLTARIAGMQQGLRAQPDTDIDELPSCANIRCYSFAVSSSLFTSL